MNTAIIGSGVAGLGCAYFLHHAGDRVTVLERDPRVGGHAHTVDVVEPGTGRSLPVDTGFMVFNRVTYPLLCRLFDRLGVATKPAPMSFSVRDDSTGLEWNGGSLNCLFAQRRNLLRPRFYRMLLQIARFNREALAHLASGGADTLSLADFVRARGYGQDFFDLYLVPMSSAVWSTPPERMLRFPAGTLLRFFHNHGFLGLHTQHPWFTPDGGSREYVHRISAPFADRICTSAPVARVVRGGPGRAVSVVQADGRTEDFDRVILACHADTALRLLVNPTEQERALLGAFEFQANTATLHTDARVLPRTPRAHAAWNYQLTRTADGRIAPATHYWMNRLQGVSEREQYFVSINHPEQIAPDKVLRTIAYEHPLFDLAAKSAQAELSALHQAARGTTETYFVGAWRRYGFHEDGFMSAVELCGELLGRDPWPAA
jgi:uncharacterized protein